MRILAGFCYVAFITDVCSRKIVGWAVSASLHTAGLPLLALILFIQRKPRGLFPVKGRFVES